MGTLRSVRFPRKGSFASGPMSLSLAFVFRPVPTPVPLPFPLLSPSSTFLSFLFSLVFPPPLSTFLSLLVIFVVSMSMPSSPFVVVIVISVASRPLPVIPVPDIRFSIPASPAVESSVSRRNIRTAWITYGTSGVFSRPRPSSPFRGGVSCADMIRLLV